MKILFDHSSPFLLAHGGVQVQIEETKSALQRARVDVEFVRWWDEQQDGDAIHYFGPISNTYLTLAHRKCIPVVLTSFFSSTCNRSDNRLRAQGLLTRGLLALPGWDSVKSQLQWRTYREASQVIVGLEAERRVLQVVYGLPLSRISVVPLGLKKIYANVPLARRQGAYLISTGTIYDVKRSIELAQLARDAQVPILFAGDPYSGNDPYWKEFQRLIDDRFVLYARYVTDAEMLNLLSSARGFVLYSKYENWSLAAHEAAACGLPLLLPDMKWSRERFGDEASYFRSNSAKSSAKTLRDFYACNDRVPPRIEHYSWDDVAVRLIKIYENVTRSAT
jgi:glycosyltransferase involved in cell wall biosynthesis